MRHNRPDYQESICDLRNALSDEGIPEDEPVFLLRAQDVNAAKVVRFWARLSERSGVAPAMVQSAMNHADAMDAWPLKKTPDAPIIS